MLHSDIVRARFVTQIPSLEANSFLFYSFITTKHNSPYRGKVYNQSIYSRLNVSAHIGPSSGQKNVQWFKNELTMGSHLSLV
jgi:hypothetical protein